MSDKKVRYNKDGSIDKRSLFTGRKFTKEQRAKGGKTVRKKTTGGKTLSKEEQWNKLGKFMTSAGATKYLEWMETLEGKEFAREYEEMLNYFKPKQQSQQIKQDTSINISLLPSDNNVVKILSGGDMEMLEDGSSAKVIEDE